MTDKPPVLYVYMDESGQTTNRYMCVSALVINKDRAEGVRQEINRIKAAGRIDSEAKWTKVTSHRLVTYKALVNYFFDLIKSNQAQFHVMVCDFTQFDHHKNGGRGGSVSKMLWQLALHKICGNYGHRANVHLFPDSGEHADMLCKFRFHLNNANKWKMPDNRKGAEIPVRHIEPTDSSREPLLQLNDIILGAICYRANERYDDPKASKHKKILARLVAKHAGATTFHYNPKAFGRRFTVWMWKDPTKLKLGRRGRSSRP